MRASNRAGCKCAGDKKAKPEHYGFLSWVVGVPDPSGRLLRLRLAHHVRGLRRLRWNEHRQARRAMMRRIGAGACPICLVPQVAPRAGQEHVTSHPSEVVGNSPLEAERGVLQRAWLASPESQFGARQERLSLPPNERLTIALTRLARARHEAVSPARTY